MSAAVALVFASLTSSAGAVTLDEAFAAAEQHSVDLALIEARTDELRATRGQAWALLQPKLVGTASYTINEYAIVFDSSAMIPEEFKDFVEPTEPTVIQEKQYWQVAGTLQQPLFDPDAVPTVLAAYRMADAAEADEQSARQQIRAGVAKAYYGLLTAREAVLLAEQAEATSRDQLDLARRQVEAGTVPKRAILQAELAVSQAARDVLGAKAQVVGAEEAFHQLTGLPRDTELVLPTPMLVPDSLEGAVATARAQRPDLEAAAHRIQAARHQRTANLMGFAPEINGRFTYVYNQNTAFSDDPTLWMAVVEGQWVLWDGGYRLATNRAYAMQQRQAELFLDRQSLTAEGEVRAAWERYARAQAALEAVDAEVGLAEENLHLARQAFEAGTLTWLEVEQAELGLRASRLGRLVEHMNRDLAAIDLHVAMGDYR